MIFIPGYIIILYKCKIFIECWEIFNNADRQQSKKSKKSPLHVHFQSDLDESGVQLGTAEEQEYKTRDVEAGLADDSLTAQSKFYSKSS